MNASEIEFYKLEASGNDFIVIDNREKIIQDGKAFSATVCRPHTGVGADGVLLLEPSNTADLALRIFNADGSEAEACGNGYRCVALFAHKKLNFSKRISFETLSGKIDTQILGDRLIVQMAKPFGYKKKLEIKIGGKDLGMSFINTGVPHTVIFTDSLPQINVTNLGRVIRHHSAFKPKGTNVNFVQVLGAHDLQIRTYERGVEEETLACGTGAVASAITGVLSGRIEKPVSVKTKSGETLLVDFETRGTEIERVTLSGSARFIFQGKLLLHVTNGKKS